MNTRRSTLVVFFVATMLVAIAAMAFAQAAAPASGEADKRVTLQFKDVPIGNAIGILFEGINHVVEPGVQGSVTLVLNDVPFTDALQALLKASGLTARKENGVYYIGPRKELPTDVAAQQSVVPETEVQVERSKIPEKIVIGYADVQEIGSYLGAQIGQSQRNGMGMGMGGMMGGMGGYGGMMGGMGGYGGMMGGMGGYGGSMMGGMGGYGGSMGGYGGSMGGYGGGMGRW